MNAINAELIHKNLKNLKWISKFDEPKNEAKIFKNAIEVIKNDDKRKKL